MAGPKLVFMRIESNEMNRILIIEDDEISLAILIHALASLGIVDFEFASDGAKGLKVLDSMLPPPSVIICDMFMPGTDGIEFVNALAAKKFTGGLVMVTGGDVQYMDIACTVARAHGVNVLAELTKPLSAQSLAAVLQL